MEFIDYKFVYDVVECFLKWLNNEEGYKMKQFYMIGLIIFWYVFLFGIIVVMFCSILQKFCVSSKFNRLIRKKWSDGGE